VGFLHLPVAVLEKIGLVALGDADAGVRRTEPDRVGTGSEAAAAGFDAQTLTLEGSSLPGYYRGGGRMTAKLTVEKPSGRVLGAQVVGDFASQADKRLDIFAMAVRAGLTASDLASLDLAYAPPFSEALDLPIVAGNLAEAKVLGKTCTCNAEGLED
jgi:hypothetical protein